MKIQQIELYKSPIRLKEPFIISLGKLEFANNVIVRIQTQEGLVGFGECSPFLSIHGESMESCMVVGKHICQTLLGMDPTEILACTNQMNRSIYGNTCIKSAIDMALYDIAAQAINKPLYALLGGSNTKQLVTDYTVSLNDPDKMVTDALRIQSSGFQVIKIKLGGQKEQDIERIRLIREAVGTSIPIRIDANQGWKKDEAIEILKALHPYRIQHCEEPISRHDFMLLPELRKNSPIPIMVDESCFNSFDAERLIHLKACDLINIKLSKSGGIYDAQKIIAISEKSQIPMQVGGFLESRLGFTAAAHLATSSPSILYCDFDTPLMFEEDPIEGGITYDSMGKIQLSSAVGLGAKPSSSYLNKLEKVVLR